MLGQRLVRCTSSLSGQMASRTVNLRFTHFSVIHPSVRPRSVSLVHDASVRIDGLSVCAKALGSPAALAVVWIWQRQRSPTLLSFSPPYHHCLLTFTSLGHDAEDGVVATDAGPNLLIVLLGVAHLVELRLQHTHTHT